MRTTILTALIMLSTMALHAKTPEQLQHHTLNVGNFTELYVVEGVNVDYMSHADSAGIAVFQAVPSVASTFMFSNNGKGKLSIQLSDEGETLHDLPTITVYSRFLTKIENSGDSTVRAFNVNAGPKFKARLIGNGRLSLRNIVTDVVNASIVTGRGQLAIDGECRKAKLSCTGKGAIQADRLKADEVTATVKGPVSIGCHARHTLKTQGFGPGAKIYYAGSPSSVRDRAISTKITAIKND